MRILFLIDLLNSGGAQRQLVTIAPLIKESGAEVEVLCYYPGDFFEDKLTKSGIKVYRINASGYLSRAWSIRKFIRKGCYDAVISLLHTPDFFNCFAAVGGRKWRVICSERSAQQAWFSTLKGRIFSHFKGYSDAIVCNSENARNMWLDHYPAYDDKLKTIYNIVTIPPIETQYEMRRDGKTHIVVAASYQNIKNPSNVIEAVNMLSDEDKQRLVLEWYGSKKAKDTGEELYKNMVEQIKRYSLSQVIFFHDATKQIAEKMNQADIVGLFSVYEGLPNAICEAMSIGKPIVMSRVSDYETLVDSNGELCDWSDVTSIRDALHKMINVSNEELENMGLSSKAKAHKLFSASNIVEKWIELIK